MDTNQPQREDHDLLVRVDEKLNGLGAHVREMSANLGGRVAALETGKMDKSEVDKLLQSSLTDRKDLRTDVDELKMWRWFMLGGLIVISTLVIPMAVYIFKTSNNLEAKVQTGLLNALSQYDIQK